MHTVCAAIGHVDIVGTPDAWESLMLAKDDPHRQDIRRISSIHEVPLILEACRAATGMGFTAIARVTEDRWITCASLDHVGFGLLPGDELDVSSTLCHEVRACRDTIAIPDVDASEVYRAHHTPRRYGFKSYISVPIIRGDGSFWGTLCAIDPEPRAFGPQVSATFQLFAQLLAHELDREEELESGRAVLASERDTARLREEFIAIVGHDLRNPIAAVSAGLSMLSKRPSEERMAMLIPEMQRAITRLNQIITNLLDFARGRLGAGIDVVAPRPVPLEPVLRDVVGEIEQIAEPSDRGDDRFASSDPRRPAAARSAPVEPAWQRGGPRRGERPDPRRSPRSRWHAAAGGDQPGHSDPRRDSPLALPAFLAQEREEKPPGARPWALHRVPDRSGAWRPDRCRVR